MAVATLKRQRLRRNWRNHPWVYKDSVEALDGSYENGDVVECRDQSGRFVAWAVINDQSRLYLRFVSFENQAIDLGALLAERVTQAVTLRESVLRLPERAEAYRLIHSEGDGIPGLIVDRYGDVLVLNCSSLGTFQRLDGIIEALAQCSGLKAIVETGASKGLRAKEGLPEGRGCVWGQLEDPIRVVRIDGLAFEVALEGGQKTGLFLDQRDNIASFEKLCQGRSVLDACCYSGGFAMAAARAGASRVRAFDVSRQAVERAERNAALNGLDAIEWEKAELFTELRRLRDSGESFDAIVLDPPSFAGRKRDLPKAQKAYTEAHSLALSILNPGGLLWTYTCSHHVKIDAFEQTLWWAAQRQGKSLQVLERQHAGADHPQSLFCPEGRYLNGLLLRTFS